MSNSKNDYDLLIEEIKKLETDSYPKIPVDVALQEAEDLFIWSSSDLESLKLRGLDEALHASIPTRAGALRHAQALWFKSRYDKTAIEKQWNEESPLAYELRADLVAEFEFAFTGNTSLMSRMGELRQGDGDEDMIQDLMDLSLLGKDNQALLTASGFDITLLDQAATKSDAMADLLAQVNGTAEESDTQILIRNKAYYYLMEAVSEVRRVGRFVFRKNDARLKGYRLRYQK